MITLGSDLDFPFFKIKSIEVGTFYNYYRDYNPSTGRYVESDPIGLQGGMNTYGYVGGDPLLKMDFFGLEANLNAFGPKTDIAKSASKTAPSKLFNNISGHGGPGQFWWGPLNYEPGYDTSPGESIDPQTLFNRLKKSNGYDPTLPTRIAACELGRGDYCQEFANISRRPVLCYDEYVWYNKNHRIIGSWRGIQPYLKSPDYNIRGNLKIFYPR